MNKENKPCMNKECEYYAEDKSFKNCYVMNNMCIDFCKHYTPEEQPEKSCKTCAECENESLHGPCDICRDFSEWKSQEQGKADQKKFREMINNVTKHLKPEPPKEWDKYPEYDDLGECVICGCSEALAHEPWCYQMNMVLYRTELAIDKIKELEKLIDKQNISIAKNTGMMAALYSDKEHEEKK